MTDTRPVRRTIGSSRRYDSAQIKVYGPELPGQKTCISIEEYVNRSFTRSTIHITRSEVIALRDTLNRIIGTESIRG